MYFGGDLAGFPFGDGLSCVTAGATGIHRFPVRAADGTGALDEGSGLITFSMANSSPGGLLAAGSTFLLPGWVPGPGWTLRARVQLDERGCRDLPAVTRTPSAAS